MFAKTQSVRSKFHLRGEKVVKQLLHLVGGWFSYSVLNKVVINKEVSQVNFIIDKSKSKESIRDFDRFILLQMKGKIEPKIFLDILHLDSASNYCLQAADLFCWGLFRKYERNDCLWYDVIREKIKYENLLVL